MKKRQFATLLLALSLVLTACGGGGGKTAMAPDAVEALTGQVLSGGTVLEVQDCAVMLSYQVEGEQEDLDAELQAAGYVPMAQQGEGQSIYAIMPGAEGGWSVLVLGESDTLHPSVESGGSRRFAGKNVILPSLAGATSWKVLSVEEQDYYEDGGKQFPCYFVTLAMA